MLKIVNSPFYGHGDSVKDVSTAVSFIGYKKIRDIEDLSHIPIVMLTSLTDSETVVEAVQSGASDYVVKPYTPIRPM